MARRVCLVLCALLAVGFANQQDDSIEDLNQRSGLGLGLGNLIHLPVGALHVPAHGNGPVVQVPNNGGAVGNVPSVATGTLTPIGSTGGIGPAVVASGLTTLPTNTHGAYRPWNIFGNWLRKPTLAQQAALQDLTTPGKPGLCPYVRRLLPTGNAQSASICGNLCHNDWVCPQKTKCCPTECGYSCFDAVFVAHHNIH